MLTLAERFAPLISPMEVFGREPAIHTQIFTCTSANFKAVNTSFLTSKSSNTPRLSIEKSSLKYLPFLSGEVLL